MSVENSELCEALAICRKSDQSLAISTLADLLVCFIDHYSALKPESSDSYVCGLRDGQIEACSCLLLHFKSIIPNR